MCRCCGDIITWTAIRNRGTNLQCPCDFWLKWILRCYVIAPNFSMAQMSHQNLLHIRTTREFSAHIGYTLDQRYPMPCRLLVMVSWSSALRWHTGLVLSAPHGYQSIKLLIPWTTYCTWEHAPAVIPFGAQNSGTYLHYPVSWPDHNILTFVGLCGVPMCQCSYKKPTFFLDLRAIENLEKREQVHASFKRSEVKIDVLFIGWHLQTLIPC